MYDAPLSPNRIVPLSVLATAGIAAIAVIGYIIAFALPSGAAAVLVALPALCLLARQRTPWHAFGVGIVTGALTCASLLAFFMKLFGAFALVLWLVGALPYGVFLVLLHMAYRRLGP